MTFDPKVRDDRYPDRMTRARLTATKAVHRQTEYDGILVCWGCDEPWPCTVAALAAVYKKAVGVVKRLWDAYGPEDYLEGEDEDYGPMVLRHRKAWQAAARLVREFEGEG